MMHRMFTPVPNPILVIEPQAALRQSWAEQLNAAGFTAIQRHGTEEIWPLIDEEQFALILLSITLASPNNFALLRDLAGHSAMRILLTYTADPQKRAAGLNAGADGILSASEPKIVVAQVRATLKQGRKAVHRFVVEQDMVSLLDTSSPSSF